MDVSSPFVHLLVLEAKMVACDHIEDKASRLG